MRRDFPAALTIMFSNYVTLMEADIIVKASKIHGMGVFANRNFKKGEIVINYHLQRLTKEEFDHLPKSERHFTAKENGVIYLFLPPERYVNHSCDPNADPNLKEKFDFAIKDIKKGEEITVDYRKDGVPNRKMKCNCNSKNCMKIIE